MNFGHSPLHPILPLLGEGCMKTGYLPFLNPHLSAIEAGIYCTDDGWLIVKVFSALQVVYQREAVFRHETADSHCAVYAVHDRSLRIYHETGCMNVSPVAVIERACFEGYLLCIKAVADRKGNLKSLDQLSGLFKVIGGTCRHSYIHLSELIDCAGEVNQLVTAHRSPVAPIDEQNAPSAAQVARTQHPPAAHQIELDVGEAVSGVQQYASFTCHFLPLLFMPRISMYRRNASFLTLIIPISNVNQ